MTELELQLAVMDDDGWGCAIREDTVEVTARREWAAAGDELPDVHAGLAA